MKTRFKSLAKLLHPDVGGDTELFQTVTAVMEDVMAMQVRESSSRRLKWAVQIRMETA